MPRIVYLNAGRVKYWASISKPANESFSRPSLEAEAFGHIIQIESLRVTVESTVYFFANEAITKTVLGRTGWLDRIRPRIVDYDRKLYLAADDFLVR